MLRARSLALLLGPLLLCAACGDDLPRVAPREGTCSAQLVALRVRVVDAEGAPARDALVTARNQDTGLAITGLTGPDGTTEAVNERIGAGRVRVSAERGAKVTGAEELPWTCDPCHCAPDRDELTLQLNP